MDSASWIELAVTACNHANIEYGTIETIATWDQQFCANAVYRIGGQKYLKVYGPNAERQFHIERCVLQTLDTQTAIPAPRIIAVGERTAGPSYLILSEIPGVTAEDVWDSLARSQQLTLARDFGAVTAAIHHLPHEDLAAVEQRFGGRTEHTQAWANRCRGQIEVTASLSIQQRDHLLRFLDDDAPRHFDDEQTLTHFDLAHNHLYLTQDDAQDGGAWRLTGIIDWGEAMLGPAEWDVAYLWLWTFTRDRAAMRACLQALYPDGLPRNQFARRCMAATLYTPSMFLLWPEFAAHAGRTQQPIEQEMTAFFFPADVFGPFD